MILFENGLKFHVVYSPCEILFPIQRLCVTNVSQLKCTLN